MVWRTPLQWQNLLILKSGKSYTKWEVSICNFQNIKLEKLLYLYSQCFQMPYYNQDGFPQSKYCYK